MHIGDEERRRRLVRRHHLDQSGADPVAVAGALCGYHATDPSTVFLSAAARTATSVPRIEAAMYDDRALVRILVMRRTVFTMPVALASVASAACATALVPKMRAMLIQQLQTSGVQDADRWLAAVEARTLDAVRQAGEIAGDAVADAVPELQQTIGGHTDKPYDKPVRITTRVLNLLAAQGRIVRGRPTGNLTSARYRWAPLTRWLEGGLEPIPPERARAELVRRWLASYGPGTLDDVQWWTGFTKGESRAALAEVGAVGVQLDAGEGYALPGDLGPTEAAAPCAALLPALDPSAMGWKHRGFYGGTIDKRRYDYSGNVCPTVWWDGRIVGGWVQSRSTGAIRLELDPLPGEARVAIDEAAQRTLDFLGEVVVRPRFPTPLDKALAAS